MDQAYQRTSPSTPRHADSTSRNVGSDHDHIGADHNKHRIGQFEKLTSPERALLHTNTKRLQVLIEAFCEGMSTSVAAPIAILASQPEIKLKELNQCWLDSWSNHRDLFKAFREGMEFYRKLDPDGVGRYYLKLTQEIDACITQLSDVMLFEKSEWPVHLGQINRRMRQALSMDANEISGDLRADLRALDKLTSDNPGAL